MKFEVVMVKVVVTFETGGVYITILTSVISRLGDPSYRHATNGSGHLRAVGAKS